MFRTLALSTLSLLVLDGLSTLLVPATGLSLTRDAAAWEWSGGKIKRILIRKRRSGSAYKVSTKIQDAGDAGAAAVSTLALTICDGDVCSDPVELGQDGYEGVFRSSRFAYDGAVVPEGTYNLLSSLRDADGAATGMTQTWTLLAADGELSVFANEDVDSAPYVSELRLRSDACGNGRVRSTVAGDNADGVASVQWVDLDGILFSADDSGLCSDGPCVEAGLIRGQSSFTESKADLGEFGTLLAAIPETTVTLNLSAYDVGGALIGTTSTQATSKYGDILIDGVPLEFDLVGGGDPGDLDLFSVAGGASSVTVTTWTVNDETPVVLAVELVDADSGEAVISTTDDTPAISQISYASAPMAFDPGEPPDGYTYLVLFDMLDAEGTIVGSQLEAELVVPAFDGESVGAQYVLLSDGSGAVGFLQGEDGIVAHLVYEGELAVASVNLVFEEPFEGPAPLETEASLAKVAAWDLWQQSADVAMPAAWTLSWSLSGVDGEVLSSAETSGSGATQGKVDEPPKSVLTTNLTTRGNLDVQNTLKK